MDLRYTKPLLEYSSNETTEVYTRKKQKARGKLRSALGFLDIDESNKKLDYIVRYE